MTPEDRVRRALRALADRDPVPTSGLERIQARVHQRTKRRSASRRGLLAAAAALVLIAAFVLVRVDSARPPYRVAVNGGPGASPGHRAPTGLAPKGPGALGVGPNGNLYIADDARNQILERLPDGSFVAVAGTGTAGFSGDGGPAVAAEIHQPAGMAFGPDGTLYFADDANNRIRKISAAGIISTVAGGANAPTCTLVPSGTRADAASLTEPTDVIVGNNGALYITLLCANEVVRLNPDGTLTRIAGNTRFEGSFGIGGPAYSASPDGPNSLAITRSGDLYIFGSNDKSLLVVTPTGTMTAPIGTANFFPKGYGGLVTAPDGSVVAMDGTRIVRLGAAGEQTIVDFATIRPAALGGIRNFLPTGLAIAPGGTIYTDTNGGGYTTSVALVAIRPGSHKPLVLWQKSPPSPGANAARSSPLPSPGATGYPLTVYPPPVPATGRGPVRLCPNPQGLQAFTPSTITAAIEVAQGYAGASEATDLHNSDPSFWPHVSQSWAWGRRGRGAPTTVLVSSGPAATESYGVFAAASCGNSLLQRSYIVRAGPVQTLGNQCAACNISLFFVDRAGRPLIYFEY